MKMHLKMITEIMANRVIILLILVALEIIFSIVIISKINYTEIDWKAYIEEVEDFLTGERNYSNIRGSTGPLVYPAGFLYVFTVLRYLTSSGQNILAAQIIFAGIYIFNLIFVFLLYETEASIPVYAIFSLIFSKRIHSIYMLRMFNDCVAVVLGNISLFCFMQRRYRLGSVVHSMAISIKMNMLLHSPGILLVLLACCGLYETIFCLSLCAAVQLIVGYPFLTTYPYEYISKAFELGRVFMFKWTVNFKFLPEDVFVSKELSLLLLGLTVFGYIIFAVKWIRENKLAAEKQRKDGKDVQVFSLKGPPSEFPVNPEFVLSTVFVSNFIGIVFARSLHYQFYCWYFYSLPYLLWKGRLFKTPSILNPVVMVMVLGCVELCFNVYPATAWSSALLQTCHAALLLMLYYSPAPLLWKS